LPVPASERTASVVLSTFLSLASTDCYPAEVSLTISTKPVNAGKGASIKDVPMQGEGLPQWGHRGGVIKVNKDIPKTSLIKT